MGVLSYYLSWIIVYRFTSTSQHISLCTPQCMHTYNAKITNAIHMLYTYKLLFLCACSHICMIVYSACALQTAYNSAGGQSQTSSSCLRSCAPIHHTSSSTVSCYAAEHAVTNACAVQPKQRAVQPCNITTSALCHHANALSTFPNSKISFPQIGVSQHICCMCRHHVKNGKI